MGGEVGGTAGQMDANKAVTALSTHIKQLQKMKDGIAGTIPGGLLGGEQEKYDSSTAPMTNLEYIRQKDNENDKVTIYVLRRNIAFGKKQIAINELELKLMREISEEFDPKSLPVPAPITGIVTSEEHSLDNRSV